MAVAKLIHPVNIRFPEGMRERIKSVLTPGEKVSEFIRDACERELKRRKRAAHRHKEDNGNG